MGDNQRPLEASDEEEEMKMSLHSAPCPLPDAIKKMSRSETVCRYCGVSYLIFNEFHKLNTKIAQLEAELQQAKDTALKEKAQREALELGRQEWEKTLQRKADEKEKCIREEFEEKERQLKQAMTKEFGDKLERERRERDEEFQKINNEEVERLRRELEKIESQKLAKQKAELEARTAEREKVLNDALQKANKKLDELREYSQQLEERLAEAADMKGKVEQLLEEQKKQCAILRGVCMQQQQQQALGRCLSLLRSFGSDLTDVRGFLSQLAGAWQTFSCQLKQQSAQVLSVLREDLADSTMELQKMTSEKEQLAQQLMEQRKQSDEQLSLRKDSENDYKLTLLRLKSELEKTHENWLSSQRRCDTLQEQLSTWQQRQEQMSGKYGAAEEEVTRLRKALESTEQETTDLRRERDILTELHNRALDKMKDDYQNELALKLCEALEKQRSENAVHLQQQMEQVHREMDLELSIDREKNRRLLLEYEHDTAQLQQKLEEQEHQVQGLLTELEEERRSRVEERRSEEQQSRIREEQIQEEVQIWKQQLNQAQSELQNMTETNRHLQQEVAFLEETVRRECEEREELTAALSRAQEQLVCLRSPASNHTSTSRTVSVPQERLTAQANKHNSSLTRVPLTRSSTPPNTLRHCPDTSRGQATDPGPAGRSVESRDSGTQRNRKGSLPRIKGGDALDGVTRKIGLVMRLNEMNSKKQ